MNVRVKLFATLRNGREKDRIYQLDDGAIIQDVIDMLNIDKGDVKILLVNGQDADFETRLNDGDVVAIFPPVGGG